jgi:hypothetical protein
MYIYIRKRSDRGRRDKAVTGGADEESTAVRGVDAIAAEEEEVR